MPSASAPPPEVTRGRAWVFGDDISTDLLAPGIYAAEPLQERVTHTLESVHPRFARAVQPGDIVIGGANFGCGSSRETAPEALLALGVGCVVAEGLARIFLRNAVAIGLPVLICPGVTQLISEGDAVEVDTASGRVRNLRTGAVVQGSPLPLIMREMLAAGGVLPLLRVLAHSSPAARGWTDDVGS